ncbi:MAG: Gfo/Idh/MocA family oxidoreductase [Candidatus Curtissbacteria bacterium]
MNRPRLAIIGLGKQGLKHYRAARILQSQGKIDLVAVCDINEIRLNKIIKTNKVKKYLDYKKLLFETGLELAIISLPNNEYEPVVRSFLEKGVCVLKEKPLSITYSEGLRLFKTAEKSLSTLVIANQRCYHPYFLKTKEWLSYLKEIRYFEYRFTMNDNNDSWYWRLSDGGGCWLNVGWHLGFILNWLFDVPRISTTKLINNSARTWYYDVDDTFEFKCEFNKIFSGKAFGSIISLNDEETLLISGLFGKIYLDGNGVYLFDKTGKVIKRDTRKYSKNFVYTKQIEDVLRLIRKPKGNRYFKQMIKVQKFVCDGYVGFDRTIKNNSAIGAVIDE